MKFSNTMHSLHYDSSSPASRPRVFTLKSTLEVFVLIHRTTSIHYIAYKFVFLLQSWQLKKRKRKRKRERKEREDEWHGRDERGKKIKSTHPRTALLRFSKCKDGGGDLIVTWWLPPAINCTCSSPLYLDPPPPLKLRFFKSAIIRFC